MKNNSLNKLLSVRIIRFGLVGIFNTGIDFLIFNLLILIITSANPTHNEVIVFNTISATTVACISFLLNSRYVFNSSKTPKKYAVYFVAITLSGLYIVQNGIIYIVSKTPSIANPAVSVLDWLNISIGQNVLLANIGKLFGTAGSMIWNYKLYKHTVFRSQKH